MPACSQAGAPGCGCAQLTALSSTWLGLQTHMQRLAGAEQVVPACLQLGSGTWLGLIG